MRTKNYHFSFFISQIFCRTFAKIRRIISNEGNARKFFQKQFLLRAFAFWKMIVFIIIFFATAIAAGIFGILGFSLYLKRKTKSISSENQKQFEKPIVPRSLFEPTDAEIRAFEAEGQVERQEVLQQEIFAKAEANDFTALLEAREFGNDFYDKVLAQLFKRAETYEKFNLLCVFLEENDLRTSGETVGRFETILQTSFGKKNAIRLFHLAAKTESAVIFSKTLTTVIQHWRDGNLPQMSFESLMQLAESQLWLLPADERISGEGFLLKHKLADLRRNFE